MKTASALYHLALADFRERTRTVRFLMLLGAVAYLGYLVNHGDLTLHLGMYRGEYSSAWIGSMMALVINTFLGLFGFYLVKDCIERDRKTGVGQIIATTPIRRAAYLVGKWFSSFLVLLVLVGILAVAALVMQLLKGQLANLDPAALLLPFLVVAVPMMGLIAALAILFETLPWLKGTLGNVVYFFMWSYLLVVFIESALPNEPFGFHVFMPSMTAAAHAAYPDYSSDFGLTFMNLAPLQSFPWSGIRWTLGLFAGQWLWMLAALGIVLFSSVFFSRFDPAREGLKRRNNKPNDKAVTEKAAHAARHFIPDLSPILSVIAQSTPFLGVTIAELRLLLKGQPWWWWITLVGVNLAAIGGSSEFGPPIEAMQKGFLPFLWIWPLMIWSGMGSREKQHNTTQMVFSASRPVLRQLPAAWLAGVLATALFGAGPAVVFLATGSLPALLSWGAAVIFIPSLAMALGIFSEGSRLFEIVYLLWWYLGPINDTVVLNYIASSPLVYGTLSVGLLAVAVMGRIRQVNTG